MKNKISLSILFSLLSGGILWLSWPPLNFQFFIFFAFVPLLFIQQFRFTNQISSKVFFFCIYLGLLIWNALTTWWICNASLGGGIIAILSNALLMSVPWVLFSISRRKFGNAWAYCALIFFWIAFEWIHLSWELTWPWLTLGNAFASSPFLIQWYEYTGHLGGSLWILIANVFGFLAINNFKNGLNFSKAGFFKMGVVIILPILWSLLVKNNFSNTNVIEKSISTNVLIVQPNIDPYNEKFDGLSPEEQLARMLTMAADRMDSSISIVIFPETAITGNMDENEMEYSGKIQMLRKFINNFPWIHIITGAETYLRYPTKQTYTARSFGNIPGYFDFFNTGLHLDSTQTIQTYHKSKLVPGVEKMPYPQVFGFLEDYALEMGGTSGSLGTQDEREVFDCGDLKIAPLICYESVYGKFTGDYVRQGANVLCVITNDGWWGNTDGYKQHLMYARLRAIENRMPVLQCANTGWSGFIDAEGNIVEQSTWWTPTVLRATISPSPEKTVYAITGDYLGWIAGFGSILFLIRILIPNKKNQYPKNK